MANFFQPTAGWFDTYTSATTNAYWIQPTISAQPVAQVVSLEQEPRRSRLSDPLDWLRERVGEYVEAGVLT